MSAPYPWLLDHWHQFESWCVAERVPHAILLSGPSGWGKTQLALAMAARLLGLPLPSANAAAALGEAERLVHADLSWLESDPEGGSRQIKIDQIRDFIGMLALTSMSGVKVGVIVAAERMNANAANALLKTLEEPAGRTHIILVSHRPSALPATIRSRCQVLAVTPSADRAHAWLETGVGMSAAPEGLLWLAGHAPLRALALQRDGGGEASLAALALLPQLATGAAPMAASIAAALAADPILLLDGWLRALHDVDVGNDIPAAAGQWTPRVRTAVAANGPHAFTDVLLQAKRHVLGTSNPNMTWLFEDLLLRWTAA